MKTTDSGILLPPSMQAFPPKAVPELEPQDEPDAEARTSKLVEHQNTPQPQGWKILCAVPKLAKTFDNSSILRAENFMAQEEHATAVLWVVALGPDAYKDTAKFPSGPWCKVGDFVMVRMYSGTRFKVFDQEFRLINDDQVEAVVEDPRGVGRV